MRQGGGRLSEVYVQEYPNRVVIVFERGSHRFNRVAEVLRLRGALCSVAAEAARSSTAVALARVAAVVTAPVAPARLYHQVKWVAALVVVAQMGDFSPDWPPPAVHVRLLAAWLRADADQAKHSSLVGLPLVTVAGSAVAGVRVHAPFFRDEHAFVQYLAECIEICLGLLQSVRAGVIRGLGKQKSNDSSERGLHLRIQCDLRKGAWVDAG